MTKSLRGSSLPQARSYHHYHNRQHNERAAPENAHHHQHRRQLHEADPRPTTTTSPSASSVAAPHRVVVQTVSLIEVVDAAGVPLEVLTRYAPPATVDVDLLSPSAGLGLSVDATLSASSTSYPSSESYSDISNETPPSTAASATASSTEASSAWSDVSVTSQPLISSLPPSAAQTPFPSLSASVNSTIPFLSSANSSVLTATSASSRLSPNTTSVTSSLLSSLSSSFASGSSSLSTSNTFATSTPSSTVAAEATGLGNGNGGGAGAGGGGLPAPTSTSTGKISGNDKSTPSTGTVVGSVVGSIAGVAFLALLAFLVLRWRKRCGGRLRLSDHTARGQRGILTGSGAPDGGNSSGMAQRSLTFGSAAVAGAAAASRPLSRRASEPSETGERGFVKVAGRKLPSVLQAGGDGYTDPRAGTANDDESVYYRDSQAFFNPSAPTRLAVGTPMRPISGVPVIQPSPARTPVTESAPFPDPPDMTQFPLKPPMRDPIGRTSPAGSRGSRASASRFTEDM